MGNDASTHLSNIGKCCSNEEIDEVIRRDAKQTLDFDDGKSTPTPNQLGIQAKKNTLSSEQAIIKLQAAFRGIMVRRLIKRNMQDQTLNSIT